MEAPNVPMSPGNRLVRDFTADDDLPKSPSIHVRNMLSDSDAQTYKRREIHDGRAPTFQTVSPRARSSSLRKSESTKSESTLSPHNPVPETRRAQVQSPDVRSLQVQSPALQSPDNEPPDVRILDAQIVDNIRNADFKNADYNLNAIDEGTSNYARSDLRSDLRSDARSMTSMSQRTGVTSSSHSRLPDFFGPDIFQTVLHNPTTAHQLLLFSQSRLCGENMEFLEKVDRYHSLLNEVTKTMFEIHRDFVSVNSPNQINISENLLIKINKDLKLTLSSMLPRMETVFIDAQNDIESLVSTDIYPRFVRHQMTMSATKALAGDRSKYAGLGDCFVLTSPSKADNPIVYASDGFVKVTGYSRNEIIPRNCRFLQGRYTERAAVKRLKASIDNRNESVELLLNYRKNGEPFWNLLYTAPLFDANGNVVFFIGGQINCSTTIHNASDVLRILSCSEDVDEAKDGALSPSPEKPSRSSSFFKAFKPNSSKPPPVLRQAGMENGLLSHMDREKMGLNKQMDTFYTAYSKYLVINLSTFFISFHSAGIIDLLYPYKAAPNQVQVIGTEVFKFLSSHAASNTSRDFKSKVKTALRMGQPISIDLTLCTRRYMGFEKFVTHWTPLKDDGGKVDWVVLTLGSVQP